MHIGCLLQEFRHSLLLYIDCVEGWLQKKSVFRSRIFGEYQVLKVAYVGFENGEDDSPYSRDNATYCEANELEYAIILGQENHQPDYRDRSLE
jgi:hypothetical protein